MFVVFLGVGAITLVAAGIASAWIATEERTIEREILADLHKQLAGLRAEIAALRQTSPAGAEAGGSEPLDRDSAPGDRPPSRPGPGPG